MAGKSSKDEEVTDSTDWKGTPLDKMQDVDSALRCRVCKEFFRTPMITSCSHTFCSICIRRCLSNDGKCPACRTPDQEMKLKGNSAMEELVEAFVRARPQVLEFARRPVAAESSKRKRNVEEQKAEESPAKKRTRSSGRTSQPTEVTVIQDSDGDDDTYIPEDQSSKDGLVACPICHDRMTVAAVEAHIDSCDSIPPSKKRTVPATQKSISTPSTAISKPIQKPEKLPHPHYSMLKDHQLRKKLTDQGISAGGTRNAQEKRFSEWVLLWNSNCDNKNPKGRNELRKELEVWEKEQGTSAIGVKIRAKNFDGKAWANEHHSDFEDLIAKARMKAKKKTEEASTEKEESRSNISPPAATEITSSEPIVTQTSLPPLQDFEMGSSSLIEPPARTSLQSIPDCTPPDNPPRQTPPIKYNPAQSQFFQETDMDGSVLPSSSQYQGLAQNSEKDSGINSDNIYT